MRHNGIIVRVDANECDTCPSTQNTCLFVCSRKELQIARLLAAAETTRLQEADQKKKLRTREVYVVNCD